MLWSSAAFSIDDKAIAAHLPSVFASVDAGYTTYQSGVVDSNDTSLTTRYSLGVTGGVDKYYSMVFEGSSSKVNFKLNKTSVKYNWQDVFFRARWQYFYGGLLLSINRYKSEIAEDAEADAARAYNVDLLRTGYGANLGIIIPFGKPGYLCLDGFYHTTSESFDIYETGEVTIGPRFRIDLGTRIHVVNNSLDLIIGYRFMNISFIVEETGADKETRRETMTTPYAGFLLIMN